MAWSNGSGWTWSYHDIDTNTLSKVMLTYKNTNSYPELVKTCYLQLGSGNGTFTGGDSVWGNGSSYTAQATCGNYTSNEITVSNIVNTSYSGVATKTFTFSTPIPVAAGATINITIKFVGSASGAVVVARKRSDSSTYGGSVVKAEYSVTYDMNGKAGTAPSKQTKVHGTDLTLASAVTTTTTTNGTKYTITWDNTTNGTSPANSTSDSIPKDSYTFKEWNTKADGTGTTYTAGATYTGNAALKLYAIWTKVAGTRPKVAAPSPTKTSTTTKFTVTYNANYTNGAISPASADCTATVTYTCSGYFAAKSGGSAVCAAGAKYTPDKTKTLYAQFTSSTGTYSAVTLPSPTRTGYTFQEWNTKSDGKGTTYAAGAKYTASANVTLYAIWKINTWQVTYDVNGKVATAPQAQTKTYNTNLTLASAITTTSTKNGTQYTVTWDNKTNGSSTANSTSDSIPTNTYTFKEWNTKADGTGTTYTAGATYTGNAALKLYAIWTEVAGTRPKVTAPSPVKNKTTDIATVTFNANGGSVSPSSLQCTQDTTYACSGYFSASSGGDKRCDAGGTYTPSATETVYAQFSATVGDYSTIILPTPTREGYSFNGSWWTTTSGAGTGYYVNNIPRTFTSDITLYARWDVITYNISYDLDGGTASNPNSYNIESATITLNNPTRTGYIFKEWTDEDGESLGTTVTIPQGSMGHRKYIAVYEPIVYTIQYEPNGAESGITPLSNCIYDEEQALESNQYVKTGYSFIGWAHSASGDAVYVDQQIVKNLTTTNNDTITLYAVWSASTVTYTVKHYKENLNDTDYTLTKTQTLEGVTDSTITPARMNYTGFVQPNAQTVTIAGDGSTVIEYFYQRKVYTLTLNIGEGIDQVTGAGEYKYGFSAPVTATVKTGYTWYGWVQDTGAYSSSMSAVYMNSDKNYTAKANLNIYRINYNLQNGVLPGNGNNPGSYSVLTDTFTLINPIREGYTFTGWYYGGKTETTITITQGSTGNRSYTAQWKINSYTLTIDPNNGEWEGESESQSSSLNFKSGKTISPPIKPGYIFIGWHHDGLGNFNTNNGLKDISFVHSTDSIDITALNATVEKNLHIGNNPVIGEHIWNFKITNITDSTKIMSFKNTINTTANTYYRHIFIANIPIGYYVTHKNNSTCTWITSRHGSGRWQVYAYEAYHTTTDTIGEIEIFGDTTQDFSWSLAANSIYCNAGDVYTIGENNETLLALWWPLNMVNINTSTGFKKAIPYIRHNNTWIQSQSNIVSMDKISESYAKNQNYYYTNQRYVAPTRTNIYSTYYYYSFYNYYYYARTQSAYGNYTYTYIRTISINDSAEMKYYGYYRYLMRSMSQRSYMYNYKSYVSASKQMPAGQYIIQYYNNTGSTYVVYYKTSPSSGVANNAFQVLPGGPRYAYLYSSLNYYYYYKYLRYASTTGYYNYYYLYNSSYSGYISYKSYYYTYQEYYYRFTNSYYMYYKYYYTYGIGSSRYSIKTSFTDTYITNPESYYYYAQFKPITYGIYYNSTYGLIWKQTDS